MPLPAEAWRTRLAALAALAPIEAPSDRALEAAERILRAIPAELEAVVHPWSWHGLTVEEPGRVWFVERTGEVVPVPSSMGRGIFLYCLSFGPEGGSSSGPASP